MYMGDASNASSFKTAKAFASFIFCWADLPNIAGADESIGLDESLWMYPELFIVPEAMDGPRALKLFEDIFASVGATHWRDQTETIVSGINYAYIWRV